MAISSCPIEGSGGYFDVIRVNSEKLLNALLEDPQFENVTSNERLISKIEDFANLDSNWTNTKFEIWLKKNKFSYSIFELVYSWGGTSTFSYASPEGTIYEDISVQNSSAPLHECTGVFAKYKPLTEVDESYMDRLADKIDENIDGGFYDWINDEDAIKDEELDFLSEEEKRLAKLQIELIHDIRDLTYDGKNHNHFDIVIEKNS